MLIKITIILVSALIGGTLMANPADAVNGWKLAIDNLGQTLGTIPCADGQIVKWDDTSGQWICANDNGAVQLNVQTVEGNLVLASFPFLFSSIAECPAGTTLTGGGYRSSLFSSNVEGIMIDNRKISDQEWRAQFRYDADGSGTYGFQAMAICASITP